MPEDNKSIARRIYNEVWRVNDASKVDTFFAANYVNHPELTGLPTGREGVKTSVKMFASALSNVNWVVEDMIAEGDKVVIRWSMTAKQTGEFIGVPATGKQLKSTGINIYRFEGGKVVEGWVEYNSLEMMQQLGVVPTPGG